MQTVLAHVFEFRSGTGADRFIFANADFGKDVIKDFEFGIDTLDMGITARGLDAIGSSITIEERAKGVRFAVDAGNWVFVKGAKLSDFQDGDFIIEDPCALI